MSKFKTAYGYFEDDGKEYVITNPHTPKPWANVISNGEYGLVISQLNGGFSWIGNSNLSRITRWNQDLVKDDWGKYIILRDDDTGQCWSPTLHPLDSKVEDYTCRHGIGYTKFQSCWDDLITELRVFVPFGDNLEIWTLTLKNKGEHQRHISVFTYFEWCLGTVPDSHREFYKTFIETDFNPDKQILTALSRYWSIPTDRGWGNVDWPYTAWFACSETIDEFEADKEAFIGRYHSLKNAQAFETGNLNSNTGRWNDSIAAFKKKLTIDSGKNHELHFFLGAEADIGKIPEVVDKYRQPGKTTRAFEQMTKKWRSLLDTTTVETPDQALNIMTNTWLKYQAISGRIWGRAAYYQQSGAFGFRDQLQDSQIFLYINPDLTRQQLLLHARHQFKDGHVLHWWHPQSEKGHDTQMTDDLLWLPFVITNYLKETADWNILDTEEPYYDDVNKETILQHCRRAIDLVFTRFSERGLPLIIEGDWNDGMSSVGLGRKGESIWLAHFFYVVLTEMITVLEHSGLESEALRYSDSAVKLKEAINKFGWDGDWYWRASTDDGKLLGSSANSEGQIFLNAQTWAIISGTADDERKHQVLNAVINRLETKVGPVLFLPAFQKPDQAIGYLTRYAPGVRENGGVYTHAASWAIWAASLMNDSDLAYRTFRKLCPIYNGNNPDEYQAEPYVTAGNIDGPDSPHHGRGGWTWYTGSAAWMFRVIFDFIIGVQADYEGLRIMPCFPKEWDQISIKRFYRGCTFFITITNDFSLKLNTIKILENKEELPGNLIEHKEGIDQRKISVLRGIS